MCELDLFIAALCARGLFTLFKYHLLHFCMKLRAFRSFPKQRHAADLLLKYLRFNDKTNRRCTEAGADIFTTIRAVFHTLGSCVNENIGENFC